MAKVTRVTVYWTCAFCHKAIQESKALRIVQDGQIYYVCSSRCRERFLAIASRYAVPSGTNSKCSDRE